MVPFKYSAFSFVSAKSWKKENKTKKRKSNSTEEFVWKCIKIQVLTSRFTSTFQQQSRPIPKSFCLKGGEKERENTTKMLARLSHFGLFSLSSIWKREGRGICFCNSKNWKQLKTISLKWHWAKMLQYTWRDDWVAQYSAALPIRTQIRLCNGVSRNATEIFQRIRNRSVWMGKNETNWGKQGSKASSGYANANAYTA